MSYLSGNGKIKINELKKKRNGLSWMNEVWSNSKTIFKFLRIIVLPIDKPLGGTSQKKLPHISYLHSKFCVDRNVGMSKVCRKSENKFALNERCDYSKFWHFMMRC